MWRRRLPFAALLLLSLPIVGCGSSDNVPRSTLVRTDTTQSDIEAINSLVGDVLTRVTLPTSSELLPSYVDPSVPSESLRDLDKCLPSPAGTEMDEAVQVIPRFNDLAVARFHVYTVVGVEKERVDYEWDVRRQPDGAWLLAEPPTCPC